MKYFLYLFLIFLPIIVNAYISNAKSLILAIFSIINSLVPIVAGLVLLLFFWGLAKYVYHSDSEDSREEGRRLMFWGVIALFVMVSVWGLVNFIASDLGIGWRLWLFGNNVPYQL